MKFVQGKAERAQHRHGHAEAAGERRLLGRREEALGDPADGGAGADAVRARRDRLSGLDIDALRIVADGVNAMRSKDRSMLVITHYQRLLNYIVPDKVHVMVGRQDPQVGRQGAGARAGEVRLRRIPGEGGLRWSASCQSARACAAAGTALRAAARRANRNGAGEARDECSCVEDQGRAGADRDLRGGRREAAGRRGGARSARKAAIGRFGALGLPHRRIEAWKYTDLRNAMKEALPPAIGVRPRP